MPLIQPAFPRRPRAGHRHIDSNSPISGSGSNASTAIGLARGQLVVHGIITCAWASIIAAQWSGQANLFKHDALLSGSRSVPTAMGLGIAAWIVMVIAMMLPTIRLQVRAVGTDSPRTMFGFLAVYVGIWALFGFICLGGDSVFHHAVDTVPLLRAHPSIVGVAVLALVGGYQFSRPKRRALNSCRCTKHFSKGHRSALQGAKEGWDFSQTDLSACANLMLLMFAAGINSLGWMLALTGLISFEKSGRIGQWFPATTGAVLLGWSALALVYPASLPAALHGVH